MIDGIPKLLNPREISQISASLRMWQYHQMGEVLVPEDKLAYLKVISTDQGLHKPMSPAEIERLCEKISKGHE